MKTPMKSPTLALGALLAAGALLPLGGCGRAADATHDTLVDDGGVNVTINGELEVQLLRDGDVLAGTAYGFAIRFDGVDLSTGGTDVPITVTSVGGTNLGGSLMVTVNGHAVEYDDGTLLIGETAYGAVGEGAEVEVTPDGVTVDGEHRGALPPAEG